MLEHLVEMSNRYGADPRYTLAGGGNTSYKQDGILYVKGSGTQLATIKDEGFVRMHMDALLAMLQREYPAGDAEREAAALADMMAAKLPGQDSMRPSVECILHALFPYKFVLHLHPALVNGLTCGKDGAALCAALFGDTAVWVPLTKPGYILGKVCYDAFAQYRKAHGADPKLLFMQNHGIIVAADTVAEVDALMATVMAALRAKVLREPNLAEQAPSPIAEELAPVLRMLYAAQMGSAAAVCCVNGEALAYAADDTAVQPLLLPFTPDQIVYCKGSPLYIAPDDDIPAKFAAFVATHGYTPKIALVRGVGFFGLGASRKEADIAVQLFNDALKMAVYAESFGGPLNLTKAFTDFILGWEVENYRSKTALGTGGGRMQGKICIVTGGAQGFGEGIARGIAAQGGSVVVADMNLAGARQLAGELCATYGPGAALGVSVNVADEDSVVAMVRQTVLCYGGLDVMVACAGIAIAGGLDSMTKANLEKVTAVNYTGYFLCAQAATKVMKRQRTVAPTYTADIIEINSKSGLEGSKANFAYAGSKFGGIGLTQSFALELAPFGIKVNAICPGNLLDGPLWSNPEKGLFKQYLDAGKVPGAKTVADVRRFYEAKVPMNRGCTEADVVTAVLYLVEQQYETGQALPVTGGQVMLS